MKITSISDLQKVKEWKSAEIDCKLFGIDNGVTYFAVCCSSGCDNEKNTALLQAFEREIKHYNCSMRAKACNTGCLGICAFGPVVVVYPSGTLYTNVQIEDVEEIIVAHLLNNTVLEKKLAKIDGKIYQKLVDLPFYKLQKHIVNKYYGVINPYSIEDYIAINGYFALEKALNQMDSSQIINEVIISGLRGRGGAGFLTGKKWNLTNQSIDNEKYVICNGDEGDPGAFMDRNIFERNPHSIVEAMIIAGKATGAHNGIVYIRLEYALAMQRIKYAILSARNCGLLGKNILGSGFDFDITIRPGAGAFVCGEETALIKSSEGERGEPTNKPPYPSSKGYHNKPTLINNVETLANIPQIILEGGKHFATIGTNESKGTKVFALSGKVKNTGLVELVMGKTLSDIVEKIGGGTPSGESFKAVQMGGPSGGCLPYSLKDVPIDYESLKEYGSMMGSGGMVVMDSSTCMVDIAKYFLEFSCDESCGKCTPCREGNRFMLEILTKICEGKGTDNDLIELENLAKYIKSNSLCGLGQCSPNPVLSTLRYFRDEYVAHINGYCPAGVCTNLVKYEIDKEKCKKCGMCSRVCPVNAIKGELGKTPFVIDKNICIRCGKCYKTCRFSAVKKD